MNCIDLTSKRSKCWATLQNIQNKPKLQKWSKSNDLHRFDVKTIKTFKTKLNYKSDQNPMSCIDLTSKRSKCWVTSQNIQNKAKLQKWSKSNDLHRFDVKTIKMLSYVAKHSKQSETTKVIQIQWLASIGCQNDQNKAKLQKWSKSNDLHRLDVKTIKTKLNYKSDQNPILASIWRQNEQNIQNKAKLQKWSKSNDLHRFDVKTIKNVELLRKTFKTTQNYESDQIIQWIASIGRQNDLNIQNKAKLQKWSKSKTCIDLTSKLSKCWGTSENIQNKAKLQKWSKSNDLHRFDVKTIKNVELLRKTFKTTQNYESDQIIMNCIDWSSKRSKSRVTSPNYKRDQITINLHRFDVKTIKNVEVLRKTFKTTQNFKTDQITMNCIDLTSKQSKILSYFAKHSKQRKTTKVIKL